jgi:hypothetical protein
MSAEYTPGSFEEETEERLQSKNLIQIAEEH